ncbi:MAG TPA: sensor histidine kinase [Rhizomicrobium sp.]|jgi:two-component sensor histidine kinase
MSVVDFAEAKRARPHPESDLLQEANHRVANHLSLIAGLVQFQMGKVAKGPEMLKREEVQFILKEVTGKIVSVGHLHRKLAHAPQSDSIDLAEYMIEACSTLISTLSLTGRVTIAQKLSGKCIVRPEQAQTIGLILGEIILNAVKHAHPAGLPVQMTLACGPNAAGNIAIDIADDGVGLPEGFDPMTHPGVGFRLVRSLAERLKAGLEIESDSLGLCHRLILPATV